MRKEDFLFLLLGASFASFDFAKTFLKNKLGSEFRYDLELLTSKEDNNDRHPRGSNSHFNLTDKEAINIIYKDGEVPVWIDISVSKSDRKITTLSLLCSDYYSKDRNEFVYDKKGSGPFGIKSPTLPSDFKEGKKFRLKR
jgi:hypothetical protein